MCPHCHTVGTLIRHGVLAGFDDSSPPRPTIRARRIFCTNRHRRRGCGRTFSVWIADRIRRLSLTTRTLWAFLQRAVAGTLAAAVRDAAAKGKIERFFRRVRDQFLVRKLDLSSLDALNRQFSQWVEQDDNATTHDALGMKPIDRFGIDLARVRFLPPSEHNDELFYAEATRTVKKDNTFSFQSRRYEAPAALHDKEVQLRHDRHRSDTAVSPTVIVYHKGQRIGTARLLDAVANGLRRRKEQP